MCVSLKDAYISYITVVLTHTVGFEKMGNVRMISGFRRGAHKIPRSSGIL
jgi:hypothetical protein